ncbi:MAG TPA: hypothetical protein PKH97_10455, partial [Tetrasphaera sp.]|uniref:hypothetical protein n=1 Tax=Nostocoides sp. TaxID=1917966 RepID=UPI002C086D96
MTATLQTPDLVPADATPTGVPERAEIQRLLAHAVAAASAERHEVRTPMTGRPVADLPLASVA